MANFYRTLKFLILCFMALYTFRCPYTKVEESFNIQGMHDILYHGPEIDKYDHLEFPGVVPRTFIGPIVVSSIWLPVASLLQLFGVQKIIMQYLVRLGLGTLVCLAFFRFCKSVERKVSRRAAVLLCGITLTQFHFLFYASRPLGNTFALIAILLAYSCWLEDKMAAFIWLTGFAITVFRFELLFLAGVMALISITRKRLSIITLIFKGIPVLLFSVGLTVFVDSFFWQKWVWPEGVVFYYNAVLNKSSNWGTSPFLWYFYSALPRSLLLSIFFIPLGLLRRNHTVLCLFIPAIVFTVLFSFLPHKELRFIIYTIPLFNTVAAVGLEDTSAYLFRHRSGLGKIFNVATGLSLLGNLCLSTIFFQASHLNYPGGVAFSRLHTLVDNKDGSVYVHIDNLAAQTGVSRFGELSTSWRYSKTENLTIDSKEMQKYTHLIAPAPCDKYKPTYEILDSVSAFSGIELALRQIPPLKLNTRETLCILSKKRSSHGISKSEKKQRQH